MKRFLRILRPLALALGCIAFAVPAPAQNKLENITVAQSLQTLLYLPLYVEGSSSVIPSIGTIDSVTTLNLGVTATITYTSEDLSTPEPASVVLMGLALTAIGVVRRRKSRAWFQV